MCVCTHDSDDPSVCGCCQCRAVLQWSYVAAYFQPAGVDKRMFEFRQKVCSCADMLMEALALPKLCTGWLLWVQDLEQSIESLSALLEQGAKALFTDRRQVTVVAENTRRRLDVMLEGFQHGFSALESAVELK